MIAGPRIIPSCGGFAVHHGDKPGETLVGWYSSNTKAHAALRALKEALGQGGAPLDPLRTLFRVLAYVETAVLIEEVAGEEKEDAL